MSGPYIFDASALVALFDAYEPVYDLFQEAEAGRAQIVFPAAAIAEANTYLEAGDGTWTPLLLGPVTCTPLTEHIAISVGSWPRDLAVRHVVYEARAMTATVVTREAYRYRRWTLPLWVI